jgi:hypothetical protein
MSDAAQSRALLLLLLLARAADLPVEQVDSPHARAIMSGAIMSGGLADRPARRHRTGAGRHSARPWMCHRRAA